MLRVGIIGYGVVGKAISHTLSKSYKVVLFDDKKSNFKRNEAGLIWSSGCISEIRARRR